MCVPCVRTYNNNNNNFTLTPTRNEMIYTPTLKFWKKIHRSEARATYSHCAAASAASDVGLLASKRLYKSCGDLWRQQSESRVLSNCHARSELEVFAPSKNVTSCRRSL